MKTITLFNYPFIADANIENLVADILMNAAQKKQLIVTPNAYILQLLAKPEHKPLQTYAQNASYVLPDGIPIVWLSKLKNKKNSLSNRLTGSDLFPALWKAIKTQGINATFIVADQNIAKAFTAEYPGKCNAVIPDFFAESNAAYIEQIAKETINKIEEIGSRFLFIGISDPKQSLISKKIDELIDLDKKNIYFSTALLGASFEFYLGKSKRAPQWMQQCGLEWLYRFALEPKRLWRRYTIDNFKFLMLALKEL